MRGQFVRNKHSISEIIAQSKLISEKEAYSILINKWPELINSNYNIYQKKKIIQPKQKIEPIREILSPDSSSWFFFIDKNPYQNWAHPCTYVFINQISGRATIVNSDFPPDLSEMKALKFQPYHNDKEIENKTLNYNLLNTLSSSNDNDYAVIISGGMNNSNNFRRYWNDCSAIYKVLIEKYGYNRDHIYVLISDGTSSGNDRVLSMSIDQYGNITYTRDSSPLDLDGDGTSDIQYAATKSNIRNVFNTLSNIIDHEDHLFIFTTDHGGLESGNNVFMNLWGETMRDDEFAVEVDKIKAQTISIVMEQCNSGGFIDDLNKENRVIATACRSDQNSFSTTDGSYNEFVYHWISAVNSKRPDGVVVNADQNADGWISFREAFLYAQTNDTRDEEPQYSSLPTGLGCVSKLTNNSFFPLSTPVNICSNGANFEVINIPSGCNISWTCSLNLELNTSSGNSAYFTPISNGDGWVKVRISSGCGFRDITRYVWVGMPNYAFHITRPDGWPVATDQYGNPAFCANTTYNIWLYTQYENHCYSSDEVWTIPSDWTINYINGSNISITTSGDPYNFISVDAKNCCGEDFSVSQYFEYGYDCGYSSNYTLMFSPNPASEETSVTIVDKTGKKLDENLKWTLEVHDFLQKIKVKEQNLKGSQAKINTSGWMEGIYIVSVKMNNEVVKGKLIIKK